MSDELTPGDRKLLSDVEKHGWHVVLIPEEKGTPGWAYSVGLFKKYQHPEVVVFGLPLETAGGVISGIALGLEEKNRYKNGMTTTGVFDGLQASFRKVQPKWFEPFLGYVDWFYRGEPTPVLQVFWPDTENKWPWQPAFDPDMQFDQPLLYEEDEETARVTALLKSMDS